MLQNKDSQKNLDFLIVAERCLVMKKKLSTHRISINLSLILPILLIVNCAGDIANRYYLNEKLPPKKKSEVEVLSVKPKREYTVIADFQSRGESPENMRDKAARIGADAVIVVILGGDYYRGDEWADIDSRNNTYSRIIGSAIKYK